jgi:hypothetical protein
MVYVALLLGLTYTVAYAVTAALSRRQHQPSTVARHHNQSIAGYVTRTQPCEAGTPGHR